MPVGGIAAVSQLIAAMVPAAVVMVYLSVMRQVRFSFLLLSGFTAIITLPNLLALVLASVCGLISPYLSLMVLVFGQIYGYVLLCTMTVRLAGLEAGRAVPAQALLICLSEFTKLILIAVIGGPDDERGHPDADKPDQFHGRIIVGSFLQTRLAVSERCPAQRAAFFARKRSKSSCLSFSAGGRGKMAWALSGPVLSTHSRR